MGKGLASAAAEVFLMLLTLYAIFIFYFKSKVDTVLPFSR